MDGMHDLGGKQGFGKVTLHGNEKSFHHDWEIKINAISGRLVGAHIYNMDEYRHAIERMTPYHYMAASYYERVLTSAATLCVEKGIISKEALLEATNGSFPLSLPSSPGRAPDAELAPIAIGDTVQVKDEYVPGHIRMPAYIRGKRGVVVGMSDPAHFPDAAGHGISAPMQRSFDVRFSSHDLWPNGSDAAAVHVGVFHSYLVRVA